MPINWAARVGLELEEPKRNPISAGVSSGVDQLQGLGYSALGGVADALGVNSVRDWANERADLNQWEAQRNGRPDLERIEGQSLGSAIPFAAYQLAKQAPTMGAILGTNLIPGVGQASTALGLTRLGAVAPRAIGGGGLGNAVGYNAAKAAVQQGKEFGASALMGTALGYGSLYGESVEGGDPSPYASAALAPLYGVAEAAVPAAVRGALRVPTEIAGSRATRMAKTGGLGFLGEAGTESFQNELEMGMRNDLSDEEKFSRRLNSAVTGGLVGGSLGSLGGIRGPRKTVDQGAYDPTETDSAGPVLGLGYSPLAGTPIIFPDGSVALGSEQELQRRYASVPGRRVNLINEPSPLTVDILNENLGVRDVGAPKGYARQFSAAFDEPSGQFVVDPTTGAERELSAGEYQQMLVDGQLANMRGPVLGLGYNPVAGTLIAFPDGSTALNSEQELQARYPGQVGPVRGVNDARVGQVSSPSTINVDSAGTAATNFADTQALQDPGAEAARQRYLQQRAEREAAQRIEQEKRQELAALNEELGITGPNFRPQHEVLKQLKALREAGAITPEQYAQNVALLRGYKPVDLKTARNFVKDIEKTRAAQQQNAATAQAAAPAAPAPVREAPPTTQAATTQEAANALLADDKAPAPAPAPAAVAPVASEPVKKSTARTGQGSIVDRLVQRMAETGSQVVLGGDIDFSALKQLLEPLDPRMHHAVRLHLGVDKDGNRLDAPMSQSAAASTAGIGKDHAGVSKVLKALGLTSAVRNRYVASSAQANERAEGDIGTEEDTAQVPQGEAKLSSDDAAFGAGKSGGEEANPERELRDNGFGGISDVGGSQGKIEPLLRGDIRQAPWFKKLVGNKKISSLDNNALAQLIAKMTPYVDSAPSQETVGQVMAQLQERSKDPQIARYLRDAVTRAYSNEYDATQTSAQADEDSVSDVVSSEDGGIDGQETATGLPASDGGRDGQERTGGNEGNSQGQAPTVIVKKKRVVAKPVNAREMRVIGTNRVSDPDGNSYVFEEVSRDELLASPGIATALNNLRRSGVGSMVDQVEVFYVTSDPNADFEGLFALIDGKRALVIHANELAQPNQAAFTFSHELAHAADQTHTGNPGVYSSNPVMALSVTKDKVVGSGAAAKEVLDFYNANPESPLSGVLAYALDRARNPQFNAQDVQQELFAQIAAAFNMPNGRKLIMQNLPLTAQFMEAVYAHINQAQQGRTTGSVQPGVQGQAQAQGQKSGVEPGQLRAGTLQGGRASGQGNARAAQVLTGSPKQSTVQRNVAKLPKRAQAPVRNSLNAIADAARKSLDFVVFTGDLIKRAVAAGMVSAKTFESLLVQRAQVVRTKEAEVERIADMYASVPQEDRGSGERSVNEFIKESTRTGKWGYGPDADPEMKQWFDSLKKPSQEFVRAVFAHGDETLKAKKKAVLDFTTTEYDARIAAEKDEKVRAELENDKIALLKRFSTLFAIREGKPFAPIKRTGDYVVVAKSKEYLEAEEAEDFKRMAELESNEDHYQVTFTQGKGEARRLAERLAAEGRYPADGVYLRQRDKHQDSLYGGDGVLKSLAKLRSRLEGADDPTSAKMMRMVSDLYLEALAEDSARKSEMRRRGIAGEVDMLASFAQQGKADANFMASVQFTQPIQDAIRGMTREMQRARDDGRASEIRNELLARYEQVLDRKDAPLVDKITRMSSLWFLATSPSYYMQNLTQPWMMSLPAMAGRFKYTAVASQLLDAYTELKGVIGTGLQMRQQFDMDKVPEDVRSAIKELTQRGKIDIGIDTDIGEFKVDGRGPISDRWNKIDQGLRHAVQKVETLNRMSTAMAAYRLAKAEGSSHAEALEYADQILTDTHGDYTAANAPRPFNTNLGRVALQFRKFQLVQLSYYAKLINDAFTNPTERKAALKALGYSLGHLAVFAGVRGLPGFAAAAWVLSKLFGDDDEPFDLERQMRNAIGDTALANLVMRGAPTLAGLDLSGKIGAGNMLSIMPFSNADLTTGRGQAEALGTMLGGASLGMATRMLDGLGLMLSGDWYRGLEQTLPKGFGDALKAAREANGGMTRRNGDLLLSPEEISFADTLWQSLGFQSVNKAVVYERQQRVREMDQNFQDRSTRIKNDYAKATRERDTEALAEAREAWSKLQEARVRNGYARQPMSNLLKAPQEQAKRERNTSGGVQYNRSNQAFVQGQV